MTTERVPYHEWQLNKARNQASRSRDPSTKCGAVIIRPDKTLAGEGYNGFPRRMEDRAEWWNNRDKKYPRVIHAEMNALHHTYERLDGYHLYCTGPSCSKCAPHVAARGLTAVFWPKQEEQGDFRNRWSEDLTLSLQIFAECGVEVFEVEGVKLWPIVQLSTVETESIDPVGEGLAFS